ncbi:hypothetical protein ACWDHH_09660 [Janibacter hoylei]
MSTTTPATPAARLSAATGSLPRYAAAVIAASVLIQVVLAATGSAIGPLAVGLTAVVAVGYAAFLQRVGRDLGRVRFGKVAAHAVTFAAVNGGFLLHLFVLATIDSPAVAGPVTGGFVMDPGWFGAAIAMPAFWSIGLAAHVLGATLGRGFEAAR